MTTETAPFFFRRWHASDDWLLKTLFLFAAACGYCYLMLWPLHPYPLSFALKATPLVWMVLLCARTPKAQLSLGQKALFITAMVFSIGGDVFLDLNRQLYLKPALGNFLFAQLAYIALFWPARRLRRDNIRVLPLMIVASAFMLSRFYPNTGAMWWPVVVYVVCLVAMFLCALWTRQWPLMLGGGLFLIADSLIGINRFWLPFEHSTPVIVSFYITGQLFLSYGVLFGYLPARPR